MGKTIAAGRAASRLYGDANPALTYVVGGAGLVNGDMLTGALATSAELTSNVGSYAITQGSVAGSTNYVITYTGANLTVTALPQINVTKEVLVGRPLGSSAPDGNLPQNGSTAKGGNSASDAGLNPVSMNVTFGGGDTDPGNQSQGGTTGSNGDGSAKNGAEESCADGIGENGKSCLSPSQ